MVAGFERGQRRRHPRSPAGRSRAPAADRGVVFQGDDSLYGWLTALGNVEFGLRMRGVARAERERRRGAISSSSG